VAAADARVNLLDLEPAAAEQALRMFMAQVGEPAYRAGQVLRRLWQRPARTFDDVTELPAALRARLAEAFSLPRLALAAHQRSTDGTQKFLFRLADGQAIETVAIPDGDRLTFCISSQAGCALACAFCATGAMGFQRNLLPSEIAGQVRELALLDEPLRATNIVFMGMGEPLMNWKAVSPTLTILNDPNGFGIGARHITVSTVGVLPGIIALGERREQFRLALSIHAPDDELRGTLMPVNIKYPLADVIEAAKAFDRRTTFEYVMLGGVNDRPEHARGRMPGIRQPDSAARGRHRRVHAHAARRDPALRARRPRRERRGGGAPQPRGRHRGRVRAATGRAPRAGGATPGRRAP
jgi:23S rRNA (adenine2503-C2)-methyltransferase